MTFEYFSKVLGWKAKYLTFLVLKGANKPHIYDTDRVKAVGKKKVYNFITVKVDEKKFWTGCIWTFVIFTSPLFLVF